MAISGPGVSSYTYTGVSGPGVSSAGVSDLLPSLDLNFLSSDVLDPRITFTRALDTATYFDSTGTLRTANANVARFDYDPSTLAARGLLIEEARTNSIRNNTMQGAVAGTPGTAPTNWFLFTALTGLTTEVVGTGTESGITYIDIRISGTPSAAGTFSIGFESNTGVAASNGQTWAESAYLKLQAGSFTGITATRLQNDERSASTYIRSNSGSALTITSAALNTQRFSFVSTLSGGATVAYVVPYASLSLSGAAINITLRIGLPQLEQGAFATSVIPTTTTALTRSADVASMTGTNLTSWFNAVAGTLYAEGQIATGIGTAPAVFAGLDDTTINNRMQLRRQSPGTVGDFRFVSSGGNFTGTATVGTLNGINKLIGAYVASDQSGAANGTLMTGIVSVATLPTVTRLALGDGQGSTPLNGWLRRISYYPTRLASATLQALTA